jgi:hypothetical protein
VFSDQATDHAVSCPRGELSMGRVVHGASCPWGKLSMGESCLLYELSMGQALHGGSCPWGELSMELYVMGRYVMGRYVMGRIVSGRVPMGRVVREPFFHHDTSSIIHYLELPGFYIYLFTKNCGVASVTFT